MSTPLILAGSLMAAAGLLGCASVRTANTTPPPSAPYRAVVTGSRIPQPVTAGGALLQPDVQHQVIASSTLSTTGQAPGDLSMALRTISPLFR
jgi:hypothetical protein